MAAFFTHSEMNSLWQLSIGNMIKECRTNKKAPEGLVKIIKHNLYAKYVSYDAATEMIEIGVNESEHRSGSYPTITVYTMALHDLENKLKASYKSNRYDMEFYAKIFTGKDPEDQIMVQ